MTPPIGPNRSLRQSYLKNWSATIYYVNKRTSFWIDNLPSLKAMPYCTCGSGSYLDAVIVRRIDSFNVHLMTSINSNSPDELMPNVIFNPISASRSSRNTTRRAFRNRESMNSTCPSNTTSTRMSSSTGQLRDTSTGPTPASWFCSTVKFGKAGRGNFSQKYPTTFQSIHKCLLET